ncbi:MAG: sugar phosphate isomerase/epimerase [Verrucomicrobia bacterium]|nr:sugar phosphate isomerase/epimerase [Verrucomicrobiota bacterium]
MKSSQRLVLAAIFGYALTSAVAQTAGLPNPFFAMDTAVRDLRELDTVKELGYAGIGWRLDAPEKLAEAMAQLKKRDLKLFAIYTGANLSRDKLTWNNQLDAAITALKGSGAALWLPVGSGTFKKSARDGDAVAVKGLQQLADKAAASGLRVALYPHTGMWIESVQDAVRVAWQVNRKNLGVTFNLCHSLMLGEEMRIPALLNEAAPYLFFVTINGADTGAAGGSWNRLIQPLGQGSFDVVAVLRKLRELRYQGPIGLQGYGVGLPPKENLTRSMEAWKKLSARAVAW